MRHIDENEQRSAAVTIEKWLYGTSLRCVEAGRLVHYTAPEDVVQLEGQFSTAEIVAIANVMINQRR